jgi:hypothetical protein
MTKLLGSLALAGSVALVVLLAQPGRSGDLHLIKNCSAYTGAPGSSCTFTSSNLAEIPVGSKIHVDQAAGIPTGMLDSNVFLSVGTGDWTVGRCTLDLTTHLGLCNFSDGSGQLTGFTARVNVTGAGGGIFHYDGTYHFNPAVGRGE